MYQKSDLKNLYDRLKRQYPRYGLDGLFRRPPDHDPAPQ